MLVIYSDKRDALILTVIFPYMSSNILAIPTYHQCMHLTAHQNKQNIDTFQSFVIRHRLLTETVINLRRACAARVTVVFVSCVCVSVCMSVRTHYSGSTRD